MISYYLWYFQGDILCTSRCANSRYSNRSRAISTANSTGALLVPPAVKNTQSTPLPPVKRLAVLRRLGSSGVIAAVAPSFSASSHRVLTKSTPITCIPPARSICTNSCPSKPSPITQAVSPSCISACLYPCNAIAPTVANAACFIDTSAGTATARFFGMKLISA